MASSSNLALKPEEGGRVTFEVNSQDLDPFDVLGWDMPEARKRQPTPSSPYYFTNEVINDRYCVIARVKMKKIKSLDS